MNENETLREQMWDLCYGLLSADESAALHKQIKSDPAAARLYAEVRLQSDLVASAAKVEDALVTLSVPDDGRKVQPAAKSHAEPRESPFHSAKSGRAGRDSFPTRSYRAANWLAGLSAAALMTLMGYGILSPARHGASPMDDVVVARVYSETESLQSGLSQKLKVVAKDRRGEPANTALTYTVSHPDGNFAWQEEVRTDEAGQAQLSLPGWAIRPGAVLELQAQNDKQLASGKDALRERFRDSNTLAADSPKVVVPLVAKEEPVTSDVKFERDSYQSGETIRFWVHSRGVFSNQPAAASADGWKLVADDGREIQPAAIESRPEAGMESGEFQLPADASSGYYRFVGVNRKAEASDDYSQIAVGVEAGSSGVHARRAGMAGDSRQLQRLHEMDSLAKAEPEGKAADKLDLGSSLARKEKSEPMSRSEGDRPAPSLAQPHAAAAKPAAEAPAAVQPPAPEEKEDRVRNALAKQVDEMQDLELSGDVLVVQVPAEFAHRNLRAVVSKANVAVAIQHYGRLAPNDAKSEQFQYAESQAAAGAPTPALAIEAASSPTKDGEGAAKKQLAASARLRFQLPPEADGELEVTLYNESARPVYRQFVRRASSRELNINVEQEAAAFVPRQKLHVKLTATDHLGNAVPHSYFAARIVKADALGAETTALFASAADKFSADRSRSHGFVAGMAGGGGGGRGVPEKGGDAKEGKKDADETRDGLESEALKREAKLKKAENSPAKPGDPAPQLPPPAPGGTERFFENAAVPLHDVRKQPSEEDRAARDGSAGVTAFLAKGIDGQSLVPPEVLMASNDSLIQDAVRTEEAASQAARIDFQKMVGRLILVVATAALLLAGLLAILHRPAQAKVWVPTMAVIAGSFAMGGVWLVNGNLAKQQVTINAAVEPDSPVSRTEFKHDELSMASVVESSGPPAEMGDLAEQMPAIAATPSGGGAGGLGGGIHGVSPSPAPAGLKPQANMDQEKLSEDRKKNNARYSESAKEVAESKENSRSGLPSKGEPGGQSPQKPTAAKSALADAKREKSAQSPSLLWQPNLPANERGEAELHIQLPTEEGDYVLLVDVQGPHGVGTVQRRIPVRVPAAAPASPAKP